MAEQLKQGKVHDLIQDDRNLNKGTEREIARVVQYCAARLQLQERLARDIVTILSDALNNNVEGMAIVMRGTHLCKTMRGVKSNGQMSVAHLSGVFQENSDARREFYRLIELNK